MRQLYAVAVAARRAGSEVAKVGHRRRDGPTFRWERIRIIAIVHCKSGHLSHLICESWEGACNILFLLLLRTALVDVGGGVWRVKWHPDAYRKGDILTACMHDGFKIVSVGAAGGAEELLDGSCDITKRYNKHSSLAYGADWSHAPIKPQQQSLIASCSFYDHALHTWYG